MTESTLQPASRFPVIIGPTAGGKSALAMAIAAAVPGEIVSCDAFQVYRGMDIGTAKPTVEERAAVPHHLIDLREPDGPTAFTVYDWLREAERVIVGVRSRGRMPIVVGGTHLYVKGLLEGMFEGPGEDADLRASLRALPPDRLRAELERVDPATAARLHPNDVRRAARAVEVYRLTGTPISTQQAQWDREDHRRRDCLLVGLDWPSEAVNPRINARVREMMSRGLEAEARGLWERGAFGPTPGGGARGEAGQNQAGQALGYKQLIDHFEGRCTLDDAVEEIKIQTRRFAKAQRTWLKRLRSFTPSLWIDGPSTPSAEAAAMVLARCGAG